MGSCRGPNSDDCYNCKNVRDGKYCVDKCSPKKYVKDGVCIPCHEACNKCAGPGDILSNEGCLECDYFIMNGTVRICLLKNVTCPEGFFKEYSAPFDGPCQHSSVQSAEKAQENINQVLNNQTYGNRPAGELSSQSNLGNFSGNQQCASFVELKETINIMQIQIKNLTELIIQLIDNQPTSNSNGKALT